MTVAIQYFGLSCFKLKTKVGNDEVSLLTDPFNPSCGLKLPRNLEANIVTSSSKHENHDYLNSVSGNPFIINGPGEYEVKKVFVYGIRSPIEGDTKKNQNTIYRIEIGDLSFAHLGNLGNSLTEKETEELQDIDILFLPVGGNGILNAKMAMEVVNAVQPRIVIPCHFKLPDLKITLDQVEKFLREFGEDKLESQSKVKIAKKDLPQEDTEIILMGRE